MGEGQCDMSLSLATIKIKFKNGNIFTSVISLFFPYFSKFLIYNSPAFFTLIGQI